MGWAVGYDHDWRRDIGYGVPAYCDHPGCMAEIDRGLSYVCGSHPCGGDRGCGLYFCAKHMTIGGRDAVQLCARCVARKPPRVRISPEHPRWMRHKLRDQSWSPWRKENPEEVAKIRVALRALSEAARA